MYQHDGIDIDEVNLSTNVADAVQDQFLPYLPPFFDKQSLNNIEPLLDFTPAHVIALW
jgi:hypothetical protein